MQPWRSRGAADQQRKRRPAAKSRDPSIISRLKVRVLHGPLADGSGEPNASTGRRGGIGSGQPPGQQRVGHRLDKRFTQMSGMERGTGQPQSQLPAPRSPYGPEKAPQIGHGRSTSGNERCGSGLMTYLIGFAARTYKPLPATSAAAAGCSPEISARPPDGKIAPDSRKLRIFISPRVARRAMTTNREAGPASPSPLWPAAALSRLADRACLPRSGSPLSHGPRCAARPVPA